MSQIETPLSDNRVVPFKESKDSKRIQVEKMFDSIAPKYDFLNRFLSLNIDVLWRRSALKMLSLPEKSKILDVATGTGDFAIMAYKMLKPSHISAIDISAGMLAVGKDKIKKEGLSSSIEMIKQDSEALQFENNIFDAATVAFGVRNFENLEKGLLEINRVLKPGGQLLVLEFSRPTAFPVKQLFGFYFRYILPVWGKIISRSNEAYEYLPLSVSKFPDGNDFAAILSRCGFSNTIINPLSFGICTAYCATK